MISRFNKKNRFLSPWNCNQNKYFYWGIGIKDDVFSIMQRFIGQSGQYKKANIKLAIKCKTEQYLLLPKK